MISWRALGLYMYLASTGSRINSETLAGLAKEGRLSVLTALKELREAGIIKTRKERIGGRIMTTSVLVEPEYWSPETAPLILEVLRNSNNYVISNFYISNANIPAEPGEKEKFLKVNLEGGTMSDFPAAYDPDDIDQARRRADKLKYDQKAEQKNQRYEKAMVRRSPDPSKWSVTDSAYEFASRMLDLFHVLPWHIGESRFRIALANARSLYGTNGYYENLMYEKFFKQISHNKKINDPEIIWKMFIKQFGSLLADIRLSEVTEERTEAATVQSEKSIDRLKQFAEEEGL